jgi:type VI secretion system secreted protein VgrG
MAFTQSNRDVTVKTALADDVLLFAGMQGSEQLGRLSEFTVHLLSLEADLDIASVLGTPLTLTLQSSDNASERHFHGIVTRFSSTGRRGDFATYEATVHPWLWLLTRSSNCRIFQEKSLLAIVNEVCEAYGGIVSLDVGQLSGAHDAALPYCVQYRETDYNFVCRLLEESGIYFYFTHEAQRHTMVLADSSAAHRPIAGYAGLRFHQGRPKSVIANESIWDWQTGGSITASSYVLRDFNFEKAGGVGATATIPAAFGQASFEIYDYPGNYKTEGEGDALARAGVESLHGQGEHIAATTNARGLYPGGLFKLAEHPSSRQNREYLIKSATYEMTGHDYTSGAQAFVFSCHITATGKEYAYRPVPTTRRPCVQGPQTAIVVGKAGEEIWTDKYGRVKVQFHWDRMGKDDENSSCWVRVAQGWAGKGWGALSVPRIGMEVVVSFLEGDPDRPLVTGCVYNASAMPPYPLPDEQTISTLKSRSSKGGEGFNEFRFEDAKGEEEVYLHAERDFLRVVKNNDALKVGFETADKGNQTIDIKNDQTIKIGHDAIETVENNQALNVKVDQTLDVGGAQKVKVGSTIVIEAGTSIELKVGGSSIKIEGGKITIKSPEIEIAADANAKLKSGAMMDIKSGAVMTIGGALVQIN